MNKKSILDLEVAGKKILLRVDFNVPLEEGAVRDDSRIRAAIPTIKWLSERGAHLVLASHLGRPKGKPVKEMVMDPVVSRLAELLNKPVHKIDYIIGHEVSNAVKRMKDGDILLLENLRFDEREENNDPEFARLLAEPFDLYVNDAFGTAHRAHASTAGVAAYIPAVAGLLMKKEIEELSRCLEQPGRPLTVILGGAKVSDKINVIHKFLSLADYLLIGGGMANTFLAARGYNMGSSFYEKGLVEKAGELLEESEKRRGKIILPLDLTVTEDLEPGLPYAVMSPEQVSGKWKAVDIGPETVNLFGKYIKDAEMVVWNGPLGVFEISPFDQGTEMIARAVASSKAYSIVGGGDLVAALEGLGLSGKINFISTGGGATLEFWEGKDLPGISALEDK
ncbi:MAG: phosphoglycerate kinase [Bacillota bacterium]|nr:phosphoglycerate kinase [Bacillota bacterium]